VVLIESPVVRAQRRAASRHVVLTQPRAAHLARTPPRRRARDRPRAVWVSPRQWSAWAPRRCSSPRAPSLAHTRGSSRRCSN